MLSIMFLGKKKREVFRSYSLTQDVLGKANQKV